MTTSEVLTVERSDNVATLWLDNAERRNAMGPAFWADLPLVINELSDDPDVRVIVVAARGPHFCVGLDLKTMGLAEGGPSDDRRPTPAERATRALRQIKRLQGSITAVADCPKPVIAAIHGACIGGGVDLITACDIRMASTDAFFSVRETKIAIVADVGTLQRLPRIVGEGHVAELVYTGKDVPASRAAEIGLVNTVLPDMEALHKAAGALAGEIAANSPLAVMGAKAVLRAGEGRTVAQGLDYVALWNTAFLESDDLKEAVTAFIEKRPATYRGR